MGTNMSSIMRGIVTPLILVGALTACVSQRAKIVPAKDSTNVTQPTFATWLKGYIPKAYNGVTVDDHVEWFQAHLGKSTNDMVVSWANMDEAGESKLKDIANVKDGRIVFLGVPTREKWSDTPGVIRCEGAGYYIPSYSSNTMANFKVAGKTVVQIDQFGGNAKQFVEDMCKAYVKEHRR
jgi:hypothetical protein